MNRVRTYLTDEMWNKLTECLPPIHTGKVGRPRSRDRSILEGILWVLRTGSPWRDMPESFPSWSSCYSRYRAWNRTGVLQQILSRLSKESDDEWHMLDSTIIRAHQCSAGKATKENDQALGRSKGGFSTKIHTKVDALGLPLKFILTGGKVDDSTQGIALIDGFHSEYLMGDAGYDTNKIRNYLEVNGTSAVIRPSQARSEKPFCDWSLYKARNAVERFFNKLKHWRRIATRYDKTDLMYMGGITLASILMWLR